MNSKSLRRLASDHASLHTAGLPPNYLFSPSSTDDSDLTTLDILLAGPPGTPFSAGLFRLHLDIPATYPTAPPTATFRTRIFHPNVDESTGAVCVETLKRDWQSSLKLRDVLITISCLLIQPNPASALNEEAGKLAQEDWEGFCRRARLMSNIHAPVPKDLQDTVLEAQERGEEKSGKEQVQATEEKLNAVEEKKGKVADKGKEKAKAVEAQTSRRKNKTSNVLAEEESNLNSHNQPPSPVSPAESDWIPRPMATPQPFFAGRDNIFGIHTTTPLHDDASIDFGTPSGEPSKFTIPARRIPSSSNGDTENLDISDPFITVPSKPKFSRNNLFSLPPSSIPSEKTPPVPKFSSKNPFTPLQPSKPSDPTSNPLVAEFSWSWQDSQILHETGNVPDGPEKREVLKRIRSNEFEERKRWELKRFKGADYDLSRYNRGCWGARKGLGRL